MSNSNNHYCDNSVQLNIPSSHSPNNYPTLATISNTTITSPKATATAYSKKSIYTAPQHMHGADADYADVSGGGGVVGPDAGGEHRDMVADTFIPHLDRSGRNRFAGSMPCFDSTAVGTSIRSDSMDNRKKSRTNCDYTMDEVRDTFATDMKESNAHMAPSPTSPLLAATASTSNELVRIKQEIQSKDYKSPSRINTYPSISQQRDQPPTFNDQLYMDASNNCWENLIHLRQKILRHKQRLQQEQTTKYFYDSHNKCNDGGTVFDIERYDAGDHTNHLTYSHERQHPYFGHEKMPGETSGSSFVGRNEKMYNDVSYEKMLGEPAVTIPPTPSGSQQPPPPPVPSSSSSSSSSMQLQPPSLLSQENIYGMMDFQQTDKISNINRNMSASDNYSGTASSTIAFPSLSNYRKVSASETSHSSSPLNEAAIESGLSVPYRDTMNAESSTGVHHMRKVSGFDKTMEKPCSAANGRDDKEFLKL